MSLNHLYTPRILVMTYRSYGKGFSATEVHVDSGTMIQTQSRRKHRKSEISDLFERPIPFVELGLLDHVKRLGKIRGVNVRKKVETMSLEQG